MWVDRFHVQQIVRRALEEDVGFGDLTTKSIVSLSEKAQGMIIAEEALVLAGLDVAHEVFSMLDPEVYFEAHAQDGERLKRGSLIATLNGKAEALLSGERVALNFIQRLSGVATLARRFADRVRGTKTQIVDTRKTTPGLRLLEKYAVTMGGCRNHRFGLFDGVLIKENHIAMAGSITQAVQAVRSKVAHTMKIEVETQNIMEVREALSAGADVIMLDNMETAMTRKAVAEIRQKAGHQVLVEASGRMSLERVQEVAASGVDLISVGALVHAARWMDISMDISPKTFS
ncbi:MAG: carboxylating nicotinate-nucleotide diphosphorylase [Nitrospirae bacterium]|nr:carboxylating nicotinate-nucleotide diphosphorylase [Nitrospirota bacterium]